MLPPKSVWIEAPMLATTFRERTVIPRTTPRLAATRCPSKVKAVVTHWRGMGMVASSVHQLHGLGHQLSSGACGRRRATAHLALHQGAIILPARLMSRPFEKATLADAVGRLRPGMKVLLPAGCRDPTALVAEILGQADRLAPLTLMGGLRLDDYPFAAPAYAGKLRFATWHHSPKLAGAQARGDVDFVPARYFDSVRLFAAGGAWAPDAVLVHTALPDAAGFLSVGVSAYALPAARRAP